MSILLETDRLKITEMTMDMAMDVHKNSLDEDVRKFVPDESLRSADLRSSLREWIPITKAFTRSPRASGKPD